ATSCTGQDVAVSLQHWSAWTAGPRGCEEIETSLPNGPPASGRQRKNTIRVLVSKRRDRFTHSLLARQRMNPVRGGASWPASMVFGPRFCRRRIDISPLPGDLSHPRRTAAGALGRPGGPIGGLVALRERRPCRNAERAPGPQAMTSLMTLPAVSVSLKSRPA